MFYTYVWKDAAGVPFYVGKGTGRRANILHGRSADFLAVHSQGGCTVEFVDYFFLESQAHAHEVELIAQYGRREFGGTLVNKTDGGEGVSGVRYSPERRAKIGASHRGRIQSPEWVEKRVAFTRGRMHTESERAKMSEAHKGVKLTPQHAANAARAMRLLPPRSDNTSGFKGVSFFKSQNKWRAYINSGGKQLSLGLYDTAEEAARNYDSAALKMWGAGNCYLNFPSFSIKAA